MQKKRFSESLCVIIVWTKLCLKALPSKDFLDKDYGIIHISIPNYP